MTKITSREDLQNIREKGIKRLIPRHGRIAVGMGTCGTGNGADKVYEAFAKELHRRKSGIVLVKTGCFGFCAEEPLVNVCVAGRPLVILHTIEPRDVKAIVDDMTAGAVPHKKALCRIEEWDHLTAEKIVYGRGYDHIPLWSEVPFFKWQKKIVLRDCGIIDPESIDEYIGVGGYQALFNVLHGSSGSQVIEEVKRSKLRGRGGAGFPTGRKWELMQQVQSDKKYVICNADEGDPGAYMNRNEIESDPHMLIEGMVIGAFAMGADEGVVYIRAEYPLAVARLRAAIDDAKRYGVLGTNIMGSKFSFTLRIVEGAGAFVCGEETAMIASIEGNPGRPRPRPPFPAQKGLYDKPTTINNVETWCNIPVIMAKGGDWFTQTGTASSAGTKVFSLVGKIKNTGLVELPLGEPLQVLVYNVGGGTGTRKKIKAVQSGGPSGGCIPVHLFNTPVDYESLNALGAIMGSGGMVVMDQDNCMVDVARYFTEFTTSESCGKCTPCREGLFQALQILRGVSDGKATQQQLKYLQEMGEVIKDTALCGLGQTGPNPVLTTLKYFRKEYDEHIEAKHCDAGVCLNLFLSPCENSCPLHMNIPGFLTLLKDHNLRDAFESIYRDNPLPASSGRICHFHCKMRCRREDIDEPVSQGEVHRYVADTVYKQGREKSVLKKLIEEKLPATKKRIAIIGSGPAGLTCAFYLVRLGHKVTVYEANSEPGGILRYGIPEYRLPKKVLGKEIGFIKKLGVEFVFDKRVDADDLRRIAQDHDAVFVATGAYKNMPLGIPGENLEGVMTGISFLEKISSGHKPVIGTEVVIIGAGNVAVDAARTAWRLGAQVTIVYRRDKADMPANKDELFEAEREGVRFVFFAAPLEILGDEKGNVRSLKVSKMIPGDFDVSGRRRPMPTNETYEIPCDTVMTAIGEKVDSEFLHDFGIVVNQNATAQINHFTYRTSVPKVYAGGDLVMGPSTAVEAMAHGKDAACAIDTTLMGENRFARLSRQFPYAMAVPMKPAASKKQTGKKLMIKSRHKNFKEISLGLTEMQAHLETLRCLRCDVKEAR
ncbi:MAG TPA: FAD-dependent oxidoreductase [Candidatus Omnitrophota bacterium]|nr:FAD-dependent oxidoreductase [Candidatus Omnitrophota bacterium]